MRVNIDPDMVPNLKLGIHTFQIICSCVLWCLEIAVFRGKKAKITGNNGWTFAVCFLSIPAWIYLIMTPRFARTRKFAHPHVMFGVDACFIVIWLSAFASQSVYNARGHCGEVCGISGGIVGLGVIITLLFCGSTFISGFTLWYYKFNEKLPGYDNQKIRGGENIDPDKAAFSMAPHEDEAYERVNMEDQEPSPAGNTGNTYGGYNNDSYGSRYGDTNPYSADDNDPARYGSPSHNDNSYGNNNNSYGNNSYGNNNNNNTLFDTETEYHSGGQGTTSYANPPMGNAYDDGPAQFPAGDYHRTH